MRVVIQDGWRASGQWRAARIAVLLEELVDRAIGGLEAIAAADRRDFQVQ